MRGQPEIIVGSEVDDLLAVEARFGRALGLQHAQPLVSSFRAPLIDLLAKICEGIRHRAHSDS